jgi:phage baseplate assembly protein W
VIITLDTSSTKEINWGAKGAEEIAQNCLTLIQTMKYEVAYGRTIGIGTDYLDMPVQQAVPLITAQIYNVIDEREPRARVLDVVFQGVSDDGNLDFKVVIEV